MSYDPELNSIECNQEYINASGRLLQYLLQSNEIPKERGTRKMG